VATEVHQPTFQLSEVFAQELIDLLFFYRSVENGHLGAINISLMITVELFH
jgi:hypothetical protein